MDAMPDSELAARLDLVPFLSWGELFRERFTDARRHLHRAVKVARDSGQSHLIGTLQMLRGSLATTTGHLTEAAEYLDDAMESAVLTGTLQTQARVLGYQCWISVWRGDLPEALTLGERGAALAGRGERPDWQAGPLEGYLGFARYAAGDPAGALDLMLRGDHATGREIRPPGMAGPPLPMARRGGRRSRRRPRRGRLGGPGGRPAYRRPPPPPHRLHPPGPRPRHPPHRPHRHRHPRHPRRRGLRTSRRPDRRRPGARLRRCGLPQTWDPPRTAPATSAAARRGFAACGAAPRWLEKETGDRPVRPERHGLDGPGHSGAQKPPQPERNRSRSAFSTKQASRAGRTERPSGDRARRTRPRRRTRPGRGQTAWVARPAQRGTTLGAAPGPDCSNRRAVRSARTGATAPMRWMARAGPDGPGAMAGPGGRIDLGAMADPAGWKGPGVTAEPNHLGGLNGPGVDGWPG